MATAYRISKERDGFAVCKSKTGEILVTFDRKDQAEEYREDQKRADEQSRVMGEYNRSELLRTLAAELAAEL